MKYLILLLCCLSFSATHKWKNYNRQLPKGIADGDTLMNCNITQTEPNTDVCAGLKNLVVINSNCRNCVFPQGTKFVGCKAYQLEIPEEVPVHDTVYVNNEIRNLMNSYDSVTVRIQTKKIFNLQNAVAIP